MAKTLSDLLVERLIAWGVDTIFGYPGDGVNGIFEALRTHQDRIRFIQVRHEESAAFAACGYAKFTNKLGVCIATSGPGGIHLLNGLYDAKSDGQPVLAITGHTFHDLIGTNYQQDVDLDKLFMDVAAYNQRVMGPAHVANVVDQAIRTALAWRTVSHITIPKDIQEWPQSADQRSSPNVAQHTGNGASPYVSAPPDEKAIRDAASILNGGSRVAILAGRGCLGAGNELIEVADRLGAPIIKALLGKAVVPDRHPLTTGGLGLLGTAPSQDAMQECDTLLIAGSAFPYIDFYPKPDKAKTVQIDRDGARIGLRHPVDVALIGDCKATLKALAPLIERRPKRAFLEKSQKRMQSWNQLMESRGTAKDLPMKPQVVVYELNKLLDDDAIICADSGTITTWAARYLEMRDNMQFSVSGLLASMGNAVPYGIAASLAHPGRQVICIVGDGGFTMLMGELATCLKYGLPVKIVVIRNDLLGEIKWEQIAMEGNPEFGVDLQPIDFAMFARSCGVKDFTITEPNQAASVLREALAHPGPALIQAIVDPNEPPLPGNITAEQAMHFAEALLKGEKDRWKIIKTVLKDRVREVV